MKYKIISILMLFVISFGNSEEITREKVQVVLKEMCDKNRDGKLTGNEAMCYLDIDAKLIDIRENGLRAQQNCDKNRNDGELTSDEATCILKAKIKMQEEFLKEYDAILSHIN